MARTATTPSSFFLHMFFPLKGVFTLCNTHGGKKLHQDRVRPVGCPQSCLTNVITHTILASTRLHLSRCGKQNERTDIPARHRQRRDGHQGRSLRHPEESWRSRASRPRCFPRPGYAEKDLGALWRANVQVIRDVLCKARIRAEAIAALAVTGHGNGVYLVDEKGNPVYNGINSADSRASSYVESWYRDGTFARVLPRTCQSIWAAQPVALLSWFQDRMPEVIEKTRWVFMCKDYIRFRLTGEPFAEITDYSGTGLVNVHDLRYDGDLLQTFGIPDIMGKLPPLRKSADICGRISRRAAEETGLREGTPVAGGLFDIDACAIATGITDPSRLCLIARIVEHQRVHQHGASAIGHPLHDLGLLPPRLLAAHGGQCHLRKQPRVGDSGAHARRGAGSQGKGYFHLRGLRHAGRGGRRP